MNTYTISFLIAVVFIGLAFFNMRKSIFAFLIFTLIQDLLIENVGGRGLLVGEAIKQSDEMIIFSYIFLIFLFKLHENKNLRVRRISIDRSLALFVILGIIASIKEKVPILVSTSQMLLIIKALFFFYYFAYSRMNVCAIRNLVKIFGAISFIILLLGLVDLIWPAELRNILGNTEYIDYRGNIPSIQSVFVHPAIFGWYMAYICSFATALILVKYRPRYIFLPILFFLGSYLSMRRKSIIGIIIGVLIVIQLLGKRKKLLYTLTMGLICVSFAAMAWSSIKYLYTDMMKMYFLRADPFDMARLALYKGSIEIAFDKFPFGAGFGRYASWMSVINYSPIYSEYGLQNIYGLSMNNPIFLTDTFWPMILGEVGILGCIIYLWILVLLIKICICAFRVSHSIYEKVISLGALIALIEGIFESAATSFFSKGPQGYYVFAAVGLHIPFIFVQFMKTKRHYYPHIRELFRPFLSCI